MENKVFSCERCDSSINVTIIYVDEVPVTYCKACKLALLSKKRSVGRPSIGITKKVSLTLPKDAWEQFDNKAKRNRSLFLRNIIVKALNEDDLGENR